MSKRAFVKVAVVSFTSKSTKEEIIASLSDNIQVASAVEEALNKRDCWEDRLKLSIKVGKRRKLINAVLQREVGEGCWDGKNPYSPPRLVF